MIAVMDFDAVNGVLQLIGSMSMQWIDNTGTLTSAKFKKNIGTRDTVFVTSDQIWTPSLVLMNDAESLERIGDTSYKIRYNIRYRSK